MQPKKDVLMEQNTQTVTHNTKRQKIKKSKFDEYRDMFSIKTKPVSERFIYLLSKELVCWAVHDENALILKQFFFEKGINTSDIHRWRKKNKWLDEAIEFAKGAIGVRREIGALTKKLDVGMVIKSMANYCDEWKEIELWRSKLKKLAEETDKDLQQKIIARILAPPIPSSNKVPEKPKNDSVPANTKTNQHNNHNNNWNHPNIQ